METEIYLDLFNENDELAEVVVTIKYKSVDGDGYDNGNFWDVQIVSHEATVKGKHYRITGSDYREWDKEIERAIEKYLETTGGSQKEIA